MLSFDKMSNRTDDRTSNYPQQIRSKLSKAQFASSSNLNKCSDRNRQQQLKKQLKLRL
ncbi:MAG: hypothetical protein MUE44_23850 [Oscillatoriaceae cyanobacterium Prado104]|jgi:hypothetical protein|nr:hypothetical protein [Oscillatoriaceae cyanobacterium Prado104]